MEYFSPPFALLALGPGGCGKTNLIGNLLFRPEFLGGMFRPEDICVIGTSVHESGWHTIQKHLKIPEENFYREPSEDTLKPLWDRFRMPPFYPTSVLVIIDGDLTIDSIPRFVTDLLTIGRHYGVSCIITDRRSYEKQRAVVRINISHLVLFDTREDAVQLHRSIGYGIGFKDFKAILPKGAHDYIVWNRQLDQGAGRFLDSVWMPIIPGSRA